MPCFRLSMCVAVCVAHWEGRRDFIDIPIPTPVFNLFILGDLYLHKYVCDINILVINILSYCLHVCTLYVLFYLFCSNFNLIYSNDVKWCLLHWLFTRSYLKHLFCLFYHYIYDASNIFIIYSQIIDIYYF